MSSRSSRSDTPAAAQRVTVGRVLRPHGLRGEVVVEVLSDVPGRLDPGSKVLLEESAGSERKEPALLIVGSREHKSGALLRFAGVDDRDAAEALRGVWLEVDESDVPAAPPGTYYQFQLLGCRCRTPEAELGRVVGLIEDGGGHLLAVSDGQRELLVPFVERFLRRVDVAAGTIDLALPPGLVETCASKS
jgi:16S rRNA processing protein RimM